MQQPPQKLLLGMLVSNGDCLMATVLVKQIKKDFPGCRLTWAISNRCRQVIENNPDVDAIWEVEVADVKDALNNSWFAFQAEAMERKKQGEFNEIFFTQIYPFNVHHFDGTTRGTIYNAYPYPVTVDARPVLRLTEREQFHVKEYAGMHHLDRYKHVLLFECSSFSGQSFVTPGWALKVAAELLGRHEDLFILLSTHLPIEITHQRMAVANTLSYRENAELTRYCTLLVGCSSGISWIATTDWAKRLPMVQFLKRGIGFTFASMAYDHQYWGLDNAQLIETTNANIPAAATLVSDVLQEGVVRCKPRYHQHLKPRFRSLLKYSFMFFRRGKFGKACGVIKNFVQRNYSGKNG